ncbi:hypothetical protein UFOVP75_24 [uncultured Caudovirales phage]|uniref:Uncharacterized protein n=1 Tax=uncultured Caudovirales phage TaxID=2100421 RepID=A0A6J5L2F0_9CAUD|nr:hypothetical protein UFOVP75_24 [uncultured Caudovirales phage]
MTDNKRIATMLAIVLTITLATIAGMAFASEVQS